MTTRPAQPRPGAPLIGARGGLRNVPRGEIASAEAPFKTSSVANEIAFRLQSAILARTLRPGERLRQEDLCRRFDVSRKRDGTAGRRLMRDHILHSKHLRPAHLDQYGVWFAGKGTD